MSILCSRKALQKSTARHKKSGWRARLPTTFEIRLGASPASNLTKKQQHKPESACATQAVKELPQPQFRAALGF